jgi:hypothetical protein
MIGYSSFLFWKQPESLGRCFLLPAWAVIRNPSGPVSFLYRLSPWCKNSWLYARFILICGIIISAIHFNHFACAVGSGRFCSEGFSNWMFGSNDWRGCRGYGVVVVATGVREITHCSPASHSGPSRRSCWLDGYCWVDVSWTSP